MAFFAFDQVFWSRLIRSRRGPVAIELPLNLLEKKGLKGEAPVLHVSGLQGEVAHWDGGFAGVYAVLFSNLQKPDVLSARQYAHPGPAFRGVYLWDSAFIAQVWKHWDIQVAHDVNCAVVELREGDRLQHVVADFVASAYTQPPLVAWSLAKLWEGRAPEERRTAIEPQFDALAGYNRWLYQNRQFENGLFFWEHPYESGMENAPRFSSRDESALDDTRRLAAPDLCAFVILQNEALAEMAETLGRDVELFRRQADELREKVRGELWHGEDGYFYDRDQGTGDFVRSRTIASLLPLWAGVPDSDQARRLAEHILEPDEFNTLLPLPSVSLADEHFSRDMWRGPVWVNVAYGVLQGMRRYGFDREASELAYRLCDGVYRIFQKDRKFYEFYDPDELSIDRLFRKKGNRWKALTLGSKPQSGFVGWTGLVNTLVIEQLFGFHYIEGQRRLCPRFPKAAVGKAYYLRLPNESLALGVEVIGQDQTRIVIRKPRAGWQESYCRFGEAVDIDHPSEIPGGEELTASDTITR